MTSTSPDTEIAELILDLCRKRGAEKTICPSEAARALAKGGVDLDWRSLMDDVRQVAGELADDGQIEVYQRGRVVNIEETKGPIRLRLMTTRD